MNAMESHPFIAIWVSLMNLGILPCFISRVILGRLALFEPSFSSKPYQAWHANVNKASHQLFSLFILIRLAPPNSSAITETLPEKLYASPALTSKIEITLTTARLHISHSD